MICRGGGLVSYELDLITIVGQIGRAVDTAAGGNMDEVQAAAVGTSHSLARADHAHRIQHSIADNAIMTIDDADAANTDYARFTASGLQGRDATEVKTDLGLVIGTNVLAEQTVGIANDNLLEVDDADAADNDFAKFTANGLEGREYSEVRTDLGLTNVVIQKIRGTVSDPTNYYTQRAVIPLLRADAAITITRIHIHGPDSTPSTEMALDLKWADDIFDGSFANAAVIDVCDTTSGAVTITAGFDDATVASGKYIYWSLDAAPHADWTDFWFEIYYTYD